MVSNVGDNFDINRLRLAHRYDGITFSDETAPTIHTMTLIPNAEAINSYFTMNSKARCLADAPLAFYDQLTELFGRKFCSSHWCYDMRQWFITQFFA
jgi:hypothetical protein